MDDQGDDNESKPAAINAEPSSKEDDAEEATGVGDDDDDDDDDWSRQVETDETAAHASALLLMTEDESSFRMESVAEEGVLDRSAEEGGDVDLLRAQAEAVVPPPPSHPELSLKERLVMRERQRRIETERARLKRQFIASSSHREAGDEDNAAGSRYDDTEPGRQFLVRGSDDVASLHNGTAGSVTEGTLGEESMRAHADDESREQLGFNMERFLRNSEVFNPQLEPTMEDRPTVMERFLNEPVVVEPSVVVESEPLIEEALPSIVGEGHQGRSFEEDGISETDAVPYDDQQAVPAESFMSFGEGTNVSTNASINVEADDDDIPTRDPLTPMASMDVLDTESDTVEEPRVLRLTEADMQEMAAIEEASIGNAPPSEREDEELSEIGELADFGGPSLTDPSGNFSQGTPTTAVESAVESASLHSAGNQSARHASSAEIEKSMDKQDLDEFLGDLDEARSRDLPGLSLGAVSDAAVEQLYSEQPQIAEESFTRMPTAESFDEQDRSSPPLVNRVLRPGMIKMKPHHLLLSDEQLSEPVVVDGFDFDKDAPLSPQTSMLASGNDSYRDLPLDAWSPAGKMHVSPISLKPSAIPATIEEGPGIPYVASDDIHTNRGILVLAPSMRESAEDTPLLGDVPPEVITSSSKFRESDRSIRNRRFSIVSIGSIFSDVRSEEDISKEEIQNESEIYLASSILARGECCIQILCQPCSCDT
jgi:hypothetical protein